MHDPRNNPDNILEYDKESLASDQVSRKNTREMQERPAAAIPMNALLALMQEMSMQIYYSSTVKIQIAFFKRAIIQKLWFSTANFNRANKNIGSSERNA